MTRKPWPPAISVVLESFRQQQKAFVLTSCIAGLLLALHFFHPPAGGLWTQVFFDSLHVPVFGLIAVFIFLIADSRFVWVRSTVIALAATSSLGALSEVAQIFTPRDASWRDLAADIVGAACFLAILLATRRSIGFSRTQRMVLLAAAISVLCWVLAPLGIASAAYVERFSQFPKIVSFDGRFGRVLTRVQNIDYQIITRDQDAPPHALITLQDKPWPGVAFHDVWPDWSEFQTLIVELGVDGDSPLQISIRAHDEPHKFSKAFADRFNRTYTLDPGDHTLSIPLTDLIDAPRGRVMDLSKMSELIIFTDSTNPGRSFRLYEIRLE